MKETKEIENKKKTKKAIIAIVIIFVLIIILVIVLVNNRTINTSETVAQMFDKQEVEAFNMQFARYQGTQTGAQIRAIITNLMRNANVYEEEHQKVIEVMFKQDGEDYNIVYDEEDVKKYISQLNEIYEMIKPKLKYEVNLYRENNVLVHYIAITKEGEEKTEKEIQLLLQNIKQLEEKQEKMEMKIEDIEINSKKIEEIEQILLILIPLNISALIISTISIKSAKRKQK